MAGCGSEPRTAEVTAERKSTLTLPKVTDDRTDLVLSWYEDGEAKVGDKVSDVPEEARSEVRVQDPTIPPEAQDPEIVYVANLNKKSGAGYEVKAVKRSEFEAKRLAEKEKAAKAAAEALVATGDGAQGNVAMPPLDLANGAVPQVVMYATKHCPVCVKARRWLLEQKIPYVEKDLETDHDAAAEIQRKGRAQGVSTNGVPIFEINGRLLPGFDPAQIVALLVQKNGAQKTI